MKISQLFLPLKWFWWEAATEIWRPSLVVQESTKRWEAKAGVDTSQRNTREFPGVTSTMASEDVEAAVVKVTKIQSLNDFVRTLISESFFGLHLKPNHF